MWKLCLAILLSVSMAAPAEKREIGDLRSSILSVALPVNFGRPVGSVSNLYSDFYNYPLGYGGAYAPYYPTWHDSALNGYGDYFYDDVAWDGSRLSGYYY